MLIFIDKIITVMQPIYLVLKPVKQSRDNKAALSSRPCNDEESVRTLERTVLVYSLHHYMQ